MTNWINLTDEELMVLFQKGEDGAFVMLWNCPPPGGQTPGGRGYSSRVGCYLRARFRLPWDDVEDVTQNVATKIIEKKNTFHPSLTFASWVFSIAHHTAVDFLRARGRRERHEGAVEARGVETRSGSGLEEMDLLEDAIETLPGELAEVFILRESGVPNKEVAAIIEVSDGEVSKRHARARVQIAERVREQVGEDVPSEEVAREQFERLLQRRRERELYAAAHRMSRLNIVLDASGKLAGFTASVSDDDELIRGQLRGVLPIYLLRQGVDTGLADAFEAMVLQDLKGAIRFGKPGSGEPPRPPFRETLAHLLTRFCSQRGISPNPAADDADFIHRRLLSEPELKVWEVELGDWLRQGHVRQVDDLMERNKWPAELYAKKEFKSRLRNVHASLRRVLKSEGELLG